MNWQEFVVRLRKHLSKEGKFSIVCAGEIYGSKGGTEIDRI